MKKILLFTFGGSVLALMFWSLFRCQGDEQETHVKIGGILPLTGAYADIGVWMKSGMELGSEYKVTNEFGKIISCEVFIEDCQGKPTTAIGNYRKLRDAKNIEFFITTLTPVGMALKPFFENDKTVAIANLGRDDFLSTCGAPIFRYAWSASYEASFLVNYIKQHSCFLESNKAVFVHVNNDMGKNFDVLFKQALKCQYVSIGYDEQSKSVRDLATRVLNEKPSYILLYGYTKELGFLVKELRQQGFNGDIYATQGFSTPSVIEAAGSAGNKVFYTDCDIPDSAEIKHIKTQLMERYAATFSPMTITAYNAVVLIKMAVADVKSTSSAKVAAYLHLNSPFVINGIPITVSENGDICLPLKVVENKYGGDEKK